MSVRSLEEYVAGVRTRYLQARKREKGPLLDEVCQTLGCHRKAAIRLLRRPLHQPAPPRPRGRPVVYGPLVAEALRTVWEASDEICSKRLAPFLPDLVDALERHGALTVSVEVRAALVQLKPTTIDHLLQPYRLQRRRRPYTQSGASSAIKAQIPLRTFGEWAEVQPGSVQADLVSHCGVNPEGFFLSTLDVVDVATGWTVCRIVWGKHKERVRAAFHQIRTAWPVPLQELHTDNGGEFINDALYPYCQREGLRFTRGRAYRKNDQAYVEQKNYSVVRRLVGYGRYETKAAYTQLTALYELLALYTNFFQPLRKVIQKEREGAKVTKRYDQAATPYQRLLASGVLSPTEEAKLARLYPVLNPLHLRQRIDAALEALLPLGEPHWGAKPR
jgi:hypothetical protein